MVEMKKAQRSRPWWREENESGTPCIAKVRPGDSCPRCKAGALAYDGLFILHCPRCGHIAENGAFT